MSVEFPEEKFEGENNYTPNKTSTMVKWVMKTGLVKDEKQANIVLVGVAVLFFVVSFIVMSDFGGSKPQPTYIEDIPEDIRATLPPEILESIPSRYE